MMRDVQMVVARGKTFTALTVMNDCCAGCDARGDELLCQELPACRAESRADGRAVVWKRAERLCHKMVGFQPGQVKCEFCGLLAATSAWPKLDDVECLMR